MMDADERNDLKKIFLLFFKYFFVFFFYFFIVTLILLPFIVTIREIGGGTLIQLAICLTVSFIIAATITSAHIITLRKNKEIMHIYYLNLISPGFRNADILFC